MEEKQEAVETNEVETNENESAENKKLKALISRLNSEIASYKKELKEKMSAEELAAKEQQERQAALEKELADLKREKIISDHTAEFVKLGFDGEQAKKTAEDLTNGNMQKVFVAWHGFVEDLKKKAVSDAMKDTPRPESGTSVPTMKRSDFAKLSVEEKYKFYQEHPDEYNAIYNNGGK